MIRTVVSVRRAPARAARGATTLALVVLVTLVACQPRTRTFRDAGVSSGAPAPLALRMIADTARVERLRVSPPPEVRAWMTRVSPTRPENVMPETPAALPETLMLDDWPPPPPREVDPGLKPPILRTPAALTVAGLRRGRHASVDLDVRVDESGDVSDALWAGGSEDSMLVAAAIGSALAMRFYPALRGEQPVAVWCRQRFDFAAR